MMSFRYAVTLASFMGIESIEQTLTRVSGLGCDAVEMYGEPEMVTDHKGLAELFKSYQLPVCGITGMWGRAAATGEGRLKRTLITQDAGRLKHAKEYVRQCVRLCHFLGGSELNICLFSDDNLSVFDRTHRAVSEGRKAAMRKLAVPALTELSGFAKEYGVMLLLEPLNRYSTQYCNTAQDALATARMVNHPNFGVMLDTFHMNIEEDTFEAAISSSKDLLGHMHFADNNRKMPGQGHIDFVEIIKALKEIRYQKWISLESTIYGDIVEDYEMQLKGGLQFIRGLEGRTLEKTARLQ